MKRLLCSLLLVLPAVAYAQTPPSSFGPPGASSPLPTDIDISISQAQLPNPFDAPEHDSTAMGMMGADMSDGMNAMSGGMVGMGGMMGMGMDMGMGMGEPPMNSESKFRLGLRRAITALGKTEAAPDREVLRQYIRQALEKRYLEMIASRQQELEKLKQSVAKLENDLKRRESAKDRVIDVQMQSVQLAAEGLLQLGNLGGDAGGSGLEGYADEYGIGAGLGSP